MKNKQRNMVLDIYKGSLIVLVVLCHVFQKSVKDEGGILMSFIWGVQMPGFMLISGWFNARNIYSFKGLKESILKSLKRYALPFLMWPILVNVLILGEYNRNPFIKLSVLFQDTDTGLWFLWTICILSIIFAICNLIISTDKRIIIKAIELCIAGIVVCFILFSIIFCVNVDFLGAKYILYYIIFYGFGWLLRRTSNFWKKYYKDNIKNIVLFICLMIFLSIIYK